MPLTFDISAMLQQAGRELCLDVVGIAPVREFSELEYFPQWVAAGHAGEMKYLESRDNTGNLKRASLANVAPWARSVIVCAVNYNTDHPYSTKMHDPQHGWISRYAWGREDYHDALLRKLRELESRIKEAFAAWIHMEPDRSFDSAVASDHGAATPLRMTDAKSVGDLKTWCYVDTGPLIERIYAKYAGVGWIGKNTCIINQKLGSWLFLGVILTSLELHPGIGAPDRCGTCTRCIDACPTDALIAPYKLDSNRCIAYLTIEKRGAIPEKLREDIGHHVFGCDICQDVCPWNRKAPATTASEFQPREGLVAPNLEWLAGIEEEEFRAKFKGSPLRRTKRSGVRRNAVIAMGNSGDPSFVPSLEKLAQDEDVVVAEHARWALRRLTNSPLAPPMKAPALRAK